MGAIHGNPVRRGPRSASRRSNCCTGATRRACGQRRRSITTDARGVGAPKLTTEILTLRVRMTAWGGAIDDLGVRVLIVGGVVAEREDGLAGVAVPSPVEVVLVAADCGGQAVLR